MTQFEENVLAVLEYLAAHADMWPAERDELKRRMDRLRKAASENQPVT